MFSNVIYLRLVLEPKIHLLLDYMCFQMGPLPSIFQLCANFMIRLKRVYLDHFIPKLVNSGDRVQTAIACILGSLMNSGQTVSPKDGEIDKLGIRAF